MTEAHEMQETVERMLSEADATYTPLSGTIELLPLCNMECRMCYVRQTRAEVENQGGILTCDEWLRIVEEACNEGMLLLLLTGGEPLLYPEFKRLYKEISRMGVVLQVNTNGTLIDEDWADFFCETGVRRLNITLYGADDATYGVLCNNPNGFTQVMQAATFLKEKNVPFEFNCSLTPDNIGQLTEFHKVAQFFDVSLTPAAYMFPGVRRGITTREQYRLTAKEAAVAKIYGNGSVSEEDARATLDKLKWEPHLKGRVGFPCHSGYSYFSINWKGELLPCINLKEPKLSLLGSSFGECWSELVDICKDLPHCQKCVECDLQNVCLVCPAHCYSETGRFDGCPDYICRMTKSMVQELKKIAAGETSESQPV